MTQTTDLTVFTAPTGDRLRVILREDEPWFVALDICEVLGDIRPNDVSTRLEGDEYALVGAGVVSNGSQTVGRGGARRLAVVSESGLYSLIMGSRKPEAKAFKRWVTHEVLPTIRKYGAYGEVRPTTPTSFAEALELAAKQARELEAAGKELEEARPAVEIVERMTASNGCMALAFAAQCLGLGRQTFINHLQRLGLVMNKPGSSDHLRPYQSQLRTGRFEVEAQTFTKKGAEEETTTARTRITPKGLVHVARLLQAEGALPPKGNTWLASR